MVTNNSLNQASEALVLGPIGVDTPDPNTYLLRAQKNQAAGTGIRILNTDSGGFALYTVQSDGSRGGGVQQYGSAYSDAFGAVGNTVFFSNNSASGMSIACENGNMSLRVGASGVVQATLSTTGGQYRGFNSNTAPAAGYIGEQISSVIPTGSAVSLTVTNPNNVTSITLTSGVWDITFICAFGSAVATTTGITAGISTTSLTLPSSTTEGDQRCSSPIGPTSVANAALVVPAYRVYVAASTTTTYYGVASAVFTGASFNVLGRLSAVRVA